MDNEGNRNLKKNRIIYGRMVQRWFLLHLSVGCHNFFLRLILLIVKCLFILAAVFLISLAISRREAEEEAREEYIFCGNQNRIFLLCLDAEEFFCAEKLSLLERCLPSSCDDDEFFSFADIMMFMDIEVWGNSVLCPFVSARERMNETN